MSRMCTGREAAIAIASDDIGDILEALLLRRAVCLRWLAGRAVEPVREGAHDAAAEGAVEPIVSSSSGEPSNQRYLLLRNALNP